MQLEKVDGLAAGEVQVRGSPNGHRAKAGYPEVGSKGHEERGRTGIEDQLNAAARIAWTIAMSSWYVYHAIAIVSSLAPNKCCCKLELCAGLPVVWITRAGPVFVRLFA
jgi:hypothetical protein